MDCLYSLTDLTLSKDPLEDYLHRWTLRYTAPEPCERQIVRNQRVYSSYSVPAACEPANASGLMDLFGSDRLFVQLVQDGEIMARAEFPRPAAHKGAAAEYRYEKLTWPEINDAVALGKVCIIPCGAVEQHGHHLPLDVDLVCPCGIARGAGRLLPEKILVLPVLAYGYTGHVIDFPGTINTNYDTFIKQVCDVTRSLAYHGFKKIILLNGHGSNMPNLDLAARRTNLETDAECVVIAWWNLLTVDKTFLPGWRESKFPGGCSHACELETSLYLYLDEANVRKEKIKSGTISFNNEENPFNWVDLFAAGPATVISWTSSYSETGVLGDAEKATKEKGERAYHEAVKQLVNFVNYFHGRPKDRRRPHQDRPTTMPMPWGQLP